MPGAPPGHPVTSYRSLFGLRVARSGAAQISRQLQDMGANPTTAAIDEEGAERAKDAEVARSDLG
jgi:hypothetical protein